MRPYFFLAAGILAAALIMSANTVFVAPMLTNLLVGCLWGSNKAR
jgi:hypothetical protein